MRKLHLLLVTIFLFAVQNIKAAETEPNNDRATANTLALNGSNTGAINIAGDEDWYSITTNGDGKLDVAITISNGITLRCYIYDNDGTTQLGSNYSSSAVTVTKDGLAAGTYYVKLIAYTNGQLPAYTVSNTLTKPAQINDNEPNNSRAEAITLPLNGSKTGHVGYYYNLQRDTADWYKVTTNADGLLRLTLVPGNGLTVRFYLYDNNGTTLFSSDYSSTSAVINQDGLAVGTYYARVICYTSSNFAPYTLSDSLFVPAQANDNEPNGSRAEAITLPLNGSKTGHVGYYYNLQRDTADWYKVTTNADGLLRLTLVPANGHTVRFYLYDNNGTTLFSSDYSSTSAVINQDGLAAGTYYAHVVCYTSSNFAPYTLSDSLFTYDYANDAEPNGKPYQAKTVLANGSTDGHVGFYYNNTRDSADWFKINYTGSGSLDFTINQETLKSDGTNTLRFQVYKDTAAAAIHSTYSSAASRTVNLTSLTQGYYWIKIYAYTSSNFSSYSFSDSFVQVNIAKVKTSSYDTAAVCNATNKITFKCSGSKAPYTVQLYRYGVAYGNAVTTNKAAIFKNLPTGSYYTTVYGDGATGTAFGKSKSLSLEPIPAGLNTANIANNKATLNWTMVSCAAYYSIQYKIHDTPDWTTKKTTGNINSYLLKSLTPNTTYDWKIAVADSANGITATGVYSDSITFTTASALIAGNNVSAENLGANGNNKNQLLSTITVSPNPAVNYFVMHFNTASQQKLNAILYDASGKTVWSSGTMNADALNGKQVTTSQFENGLYYLRIMNEKGMILGNIKVSIVK